MPLVQNDLATMMREAAGGDDWPWMATLLREAAGRIEELEAQIPAPPPET